MNHCTTIKEMISLYMDNELDMDARRTFEAHMETCESCRNEWEEMKQVMELCKQEEELPENFNLELHEKLIFAAQQQDKIRKFQEMRNRFLRMGTAVAAVLLFTILMRGFFTQYFHVNVKDQEMNIASDTIPTVDTDDKYKDAEKTRDSSSSSVTDNAMPQGEVEMNAMDRVTFAASETPVDGHGGGSSEKSSPVAPTGSANDVQTGAAAIAPEQSEASSLTMTPSLGIKAAEGQEQTTMAGEGNQIKALKIISSDRATMAEKVKLIASANQAVPILPVEAFTTSTSIQADVTAKVEVKESELVFLVKNEKVEEFVRAIRTQLSGFEISGGVQSRDQAVQTTTALNNSLAEINAKIKEVENNTKAPLDQSTLDGLVKERESILVALERIKNESAYTKISVVITEQ